MPKSGKTALCKKSGGKITPGGVRERRGKGEKTKKDNDDKADMGKETGGKEHKKHV